MEPDQHSATVGSESDPFKAWTKTTQGRQCLDALSLRTPLSQAQVLRNRLRAAFEAGMVAAREAIVAPCQPAPRKHPVFASIEELLK